jgi:hypothetical protein
MRWILVAAVLIVSACATTPEDDQSRANRFCGVADHPEEHWSLAAAPGDAAAMRALAQPTPSARPTPDYEREFWYSGLDNRTRLCILDMRPRYTACNIRRWDFARDDNSGPMTLSAQQRVCAS